MKVKLTESNIKNMVYEAVKATLKEMDYMGGYMPYEEKDDNSKKSSTHKNKIYNQSKKSDSDTEARGEVEDFFEKDGINAAPYAYKLYGVKPEEGKDTNDMKNARGLFAKALHHEKNDNGSIYTLSSSQVNRLESMISSDGLNEAISKAIKKVLK